MAPCLSRPDSHRRRCRRRVAGSRAVERPAAASATEPTSWVTPYCAGPAAAWQGGSGRGYRPVGPATPRYAPLRPATPKYRDRQIVSCCGAAQSRPPKIAVRNDEPLVWPEHIYSNPSNPLAEQAAEPARDQEPGAPRTVAREVRRTRCNTQRSPRPPSWPEAARSSPSASAPRTSRCSRAPPSSPTTTTVARAPAADRRRHRPCGSRAAPGEQRKGHDGAYPERASNVSLRSA